jgi:hypothetical protein
MEETDEDAPLTDLLLFSPPCLSVLILTRPDDTDGRIDRLLKVELRDCSSAELVLFNEDSDKDELRYILDLRALVHKEEEEVDEKKNLCSVLYTLERDGERLQFQVIPSSEAGLRDVQAFDFILGQYAMKDETAKKGDVIQELNDRDPNVVAQTLENTGTVVRIALRSSGAYTGHAIRFLGQQYTSVVSSMFPREDSSHSADHGGDIGAASPIVPSERAGSDDDTPNDDPDTSLPAATVAPSAGDIDHELVTRAEERQRWAEGVHSTVASVAGAVLYPVRWTGRMASTYGGKGGSDRPNEPTGPVSKAVLDTVGGLGNGVMAVCKGVTEAIGEVGSAIGDSAMHHSVTMHGPEYAENVTKHYVNAASELGLASYKVANVAALGWQGVLVNAALEGTTYLVSLYEYLIGPVLLQGYMEMMQMPLVKVRRYFVVLRPWSIAFYKSASDITRKPFKIVATSMLDTLPKLRMRAVSGAKAALVARDQDQLERSARLNDVAASVSHPETEESDSLYWHRSDYDAFDEDSDRGEDDGLLAPLSGQKAGAGDPGDNIDPGGRASLSATMQRTAGRLRGIVHQLGGGAASHIELCTVDCSTYLLYPPEDMIHLWYAELSEATSRVETIAKRKSGADEIALYRRLDLYPISAMVTVRARRFVRTTPKPSLFDLFTRRRSEMNTAEVTHTGDGDAAELDGSGERESSDSEDAESGTDLESAAERATLNMEPSAASNTVADRHTVLAAAAAAAMESEAVVSEEHSDSEDGYESAHFWAVEEPGFLDGSYFDVSEMNSPELLDGDAPGDRSAPVSPAPTPPSPADAMFVTPPQEVESEGREAVPVPQEGMMRMHPAPMPSAVAMEYPETETTGHKKNRRTVQHADPAAEAQHAKRPYFSPELQCSMYPIANSGS